ncbi:DUF5722 domain-containing protein [Paenibacillus mendelii]|uniref:DUF5722 domain-containing protein n=1 Tax=Paenibacillus mendelii TaxID=206163 RepID=A0ABV6J9F8_9BACL|nr:DUF5722 domain-containing protein [Paenibacillus mendelii]MCQ6559755.1 DUF5722 domain-containing protein [Paenibacillus mendelii]
MKRHVPRWVAAVVSAVLLLTVMPIGASAVSSMTASLTSCTTAGAGAITGVTVGTSVITVTGWSRASTSGSIEIYELQPYEDATTAVVSVKTPLTSASVTPSSESCYNYTASIDRFDGSRDRLYSKFAAAFKTTSAVYTVADAKHATAFSGIALNNYAFPTSTTKKGLQVQMLDDAQELGLGHAALNFEYNDLLLDSPGTNTIPYVMDGETFYINKSKIEGFDTRVKSLSDNGMIVSLILLIYPGSTSSPSTLIMHPDYTSSGIVGAFNTTNANLKYFKAATEFIIERYTRADQQYGRAVNFIVGNEVNSNYVWYNMGNKTLANFVKDYIRTLRIVYNAAMKKYSNARIYVSLDHFWSVNLGGTGNGFQPGKSVTDLINTEVKALGNFPWHIAYHPYPQNLFEPRTWNDTTATNSFTTQRITFKNLNILTDYLNQTDFLYNSAPRRVILSEQGFHTSNPASAADQSVQAAAYAYAYYKVLFNTGIDSFILHRHTDHSQEGGLNLGIWQRASDSIASPSAKKQIWNVMKRIDTAQSEEVTSFAKNIIGFSDWSTVIPGWNASALNVSPAPTVVSLDPILSSSGTKVSIASFNSTNDGWIAADYGISSNRVTSMANGPGTPYEGAGMLETSFSTSTGEGGASAWKGTTKAFATPLNLSSTPYFTFAVNSYGGAPSATKYTVKVRLYSGTSILEGEGEMSPDSWNVLGMNISQWGGKSSIDRIKVWYKANTTSSWGGNFQIDGIEAASSAVFKDLHGEFNVSGDVEGWTPLNQISGLTAAGTTLDGTLTGTDPQLQSAPISAAAASKNKVTIRMKNNTNATIAKLYWTTNTSPGYDAAKSVSFTVTANDDRYREYVVDLSGTASWANTVTQLRVDPADNSSGSGTFSIDYVRLLNAVYKHWDYPVNGSLDGWGSAHDLTTSAAGGKLTVTVTGIDPYIYSPSSLGMDASKYKTIQIKMKNNSTARMAKIYWTRTGEGMSEDRIRYFAITPSDTIERVYTIDMSDELLWSGTISQFRLDPTEDVSSGNVVIDYISVPATK